jgi:hypothetical protein
MDNCSFVDADQQYRVMVDWRCSSGVKVIWVTEPRNIVCAGVLSAYGRC